MCVDRRRISPVHTEWWETIGIRDPDADIPEELKDLDYVPLVAASTPPWTDSTEIPEGFLPSRVCRAGRKQASGASRRKT